MLTTLHATDLTKLPLDILQYLMQNSVFQGGNGTWGPKMALIGLADGMMESSA